MNGTPIKKLARDLNMRVGDLITQLQESGANIACEDDLVSGEQQLRLLKQINATSPSIDDNFTNTRVNPVQRTQDIAIDDLQSAKDLATLNDLLTQALADRTIQSLIKDENLETITNAILERAVKENDPLLAAAALGRLAALPGARTSSIYSFSDQVFPDEPPPLESLADRDGKKKGYAAQMLAHVSAPWVAAYRYREALAIDTADHARRELLAANLAHECTIADWIAAIAHHALELRGIDNPETRLKRIRRLFGAMRDVADRWRDEVGTDAGLRLAECLRAFLTGKLADLEQPVLIETVDHLLGILDRLIQLRFSMALYADTYAVLDQGKRTLGPGLWGRFLSQSAVIPDVRVALLEAALVVARQNRTDKHIMVMLNAVFTSRPQVTAAIGRHFHNADDLDPDVNEWWRHGEADTRPEDQETQRIRSTEDEKIGELLIQVEGSREVMEKLGRAVLPLLENFDPVLAETVNRAAADYREMAQLVRGLARIRKLNLTDVVGTRPEYNLRKHEMIGGHRPGVRYVRVVREGVEKRFGGKVKMLVNPWVEAEG